MRRVSTEADRLRYRRALKPLRLPRFGARPQGAGLVVAVEGANGTGKSTLCGALGGRPGVELCLGTDAAWFSEQFKTRMIRDAQWFASAMFFLSGCLEQMRLLEGRTGSMMIMDRSFWSTLAVHAAHSVQRLKALLAMVRPIAREIRVPDLTVVLEASFGTCQSRIGNKAGPARALDELTATRAFHGREQEFYRWLGRQRPEVVFLNVDEARAEEVARQAWDLIQDRARC